MKPLRLEVSGLTCFREKVEIDFGALALVGIEGPTGAGKSSLLDAMILALYGRVPRMGAHGLAELISHGRSGLAVTLDFEIRKTQWRVARTLSRARPGQAILAELVDDGAGGRVEKKKANGVDEVKREVKALLGIDVAAFQQAVILPQGKFQEFLQSQPADRRRILSELLGLQVYAQMRAKAAELVHKLQAEVEVLARQLTGDLALASAEVVAELEVQEAAARDLREATRAAAEAARASVSEIERVAEKCAEMIVIDKALASLEAREAVVSDVEARAARARAVMPVMPLVAAVEGATVRAGGLAEKARALAAAGPALAAAVAAAEATAHAAESALAQVASMRERIAQLDEAKARFEQKAELAAEVARTGKTAATARAAAAEGERAAATALAAHAAAEVRLAAVEAEDVPVVSAEELARWEAARETALRIERARESMREETAALAAQRQVVERAEAASVAAERERKVKEAGEVVADEALEAARVALEAAEHAARVGLVREHLHAGQACPVCEQVVAVVPASAVGVEVASAREATVAAKRHLDKVRGEAERARAKAAEARVKGEEAEARAGEIAARLARVAAALAEDEAALAAVMARAGGDVVSPLAVGSGGDDAAGEAIEVRYRRLFERALAGAKRRARHEATLVEARREVETARLAHELRAGQATAARARAGELEAERAAAQARLDAVEVSLAALGSSDPKKERAALVREIDKLEARRRASVDALTAAQGRRAEHEAQAAAVAALAREADVEVVAAAAALAASGYSADEVRDATLSADELAGADAMVGAHRAAKAAKTAARAALVKALGPARAGPDEVAAARAASGEADARAGGAAERAAVLGERVRQAKEQLAKVGGVRAEHEAKLKSLGVHRRLADDLSPKHFQEFLLEEVIADLVRGASERLFALSGGRYRMAADTASGFLVIDLDNAGERRSTDTLSGGETFLASLAMALELSEQIRAKAGRVDLDCIFIDEGFGTLDPETLETVTEAVEGLQRPGRLVGIITHVGELARRMPERIVVEKAQGGSTVRVVAGA